MSMRNAAVAIFVPTAICICGCAHSTWSGQIDRWGTLREVMREGSTSGRVQLSEAATRHVYGIGALEALGGEIIIIDGDAWVGQCSTEGSTTEEPSGTSDYIATLLATTYVPRWRRQSIDQDLTRDELEDYLKQTAAKARIDTDEAFPFMLVGTFIDCSLHILNGSCPYAEQADKPEQPPCRSHYDSAKGTLVGFYAENAAGVLTHHGRRTHIHSLLREPSLIAGHVDDLVVPAGATLYLPALP